MFTADEPEHWSVFAVSEDAERLQVERLRAFRAARDNDAVERGLAQLAAAVSDEGEIMPRVLECFRADATLGEVMGVFRDAWGRGSVY
jgi:methylmalonyl-CoA mutase N-terminal domain/subunit